MDGAIDKLVNPVLLEKVMFRVSIFNAPTDDDEDVASGFDLAEFTEVTLGALGSSVDDFLVYVLVGATAMLPYGSGEGYCGNVLTAMSGFSGSSNDRNDIVSSSKLSRDDGKLTSSTDAVSEAN